MFYIAIILCIFGWLFFRANTRRGVNFVRSYYFLLCLDEGKTLEEANYLARRILTRNSNSDDDNQLMQKASDFSKESFNGKQLPIINEAILKGFIK